MVRLKGSKMAPENPLKGNFNSKMVRLKVTINGSNVNINSGFQFQNGAIKRS